MSRCPTTKESRSESTTVVLFQHRRETLNLHHPSQGERQPTNGSPPVPDPFRGVYLYALRTGLISFPSTACSHSFFPPPCLSFLSFPFLFLSFPVRLEDHPIKFKHRPACLPSLFLSLFHPISFASSDHRFTRLAGVLSFSDENKSQSNQLLDRLLRSKLSSS